MELIPECSFRSIYVSIVIHPIFYENAECIACMRKNNVEIIIQCYSRSFKEN